MDTPETQTRADAQAPDTSDNPSAARMEAILHLILSSENEEELDANKALAQKVLAMSDDDVRALQHPRQHARQGDFLQAVRKD